MPNDLGIEVFGSKGHARFSSAQMDQLVIYEVGDAKPGFDGPRVVSAGPDFPYFGSPAAMPGRGVGTGYGEAFMGNDQLALGVLASLGAHDIAVPERVAVIGHDDTPLARHTGLTSIDQHASKQGRLAAEAVVTMVSGENPSFAPLRPELQVRRTA